MLVELFFLKPYFLVNDDLFQLFILKGIGLSLAPSPLVHSSHYFFSYPLHLLYQWSPSFPWYGVSLLTIQGLSFASLLLALTVSVQNRIAPFLLGVVFMTTFGFFSFQNINFTLTAGLAFQCGFFLLLRLVDDEGLSNPRLPLLLGSLCLFFSFLSRPETFIICAALSTPFLLMTYRHTTRRKAIQRFLAISIALFSLLLWVDHFQYSRTPEWKTYCKTIPLIRDLHDFHQLDYSPSTKPVYDRAGWSRNDFYLFWSWYFWDKDIYSAEKLHFINSHFSSRKPPITIYRQCKDFFSDSTFLGLIGCFLLSLFLLRRDHYERIVLYGCWGAGFILIFATWYKIPERIMFPIISFIALGTMYHCFHPGHRPVLPNFGTAKSRLWLTLVLALCLANVLVALKVDQQKRTKEAVLKESVSRLNPHASDLYIIWDSQFPFERIGAFDNLKRYETFKMLSFAGYQQSPIADQMLSHFGISNPLRDSIDNPHVFFICNTIEGILGLHYLQEKFGVVPQPFKTFHCPYFRVFQFRKTAPK
jgi:hypothetical protein